MNKSMIELFTETIDEKWKLNRQKKTWQLSENNIDIEFKTSSNKSFGFSLDQNNIKDVFAFLSANPPKGVAKMCDGIITLSYKEKNYIFLIEQKANNHGEYKKQLINGWYFCKWLLNLFKEYKHYSGEVEYIGLLYCSRKMTRKATSTHSTPTMKSDKYGIKFFKTNETTVCLEDYVS